MSVTSRGHFLQTEHGKFIRSTVIVVPKQLATTPEELRQVGQGDPHVREKRNRRFVHLPYPHKKTPCQSDRWCVDPEDKGDGTTLLGETEVFAKIPEGEVVIEEQPNRAVMFVEQGEKPRF